MLLPPEGAPALCVIGLGGNLDAPADRVMRARQILASREGVREVAFSSLYKSRPMGPKDQPDYVNAVMAIESRLGPLELLDLLQSVESSEGRVRLGERWVQGLLTSISSSMGTASSSTRGWLFRILALQCESLCCTRWPKFFRLLKSLA